MNISIHTFCSQKSFIVNNYRVSNFNIWSYPFVGSFRMYPHFLRLNGRYVQGGTTFTNINSDNLTSVPYTCNSYQQFDSFPLIVY